MVRRRKQSLDDSFDMFLDTITNTFGGVLLIALLIVLMIRESSDSAPQQKRSGPTEDAALVRSEIAALRAQKNALAASLKINQQFESDFQSDELKALVQSLAQLTSKKASTEQSLNQASSKSRQLDLKKKGIKTRQEALNQQLAQQANKLKELNDQVVKEQQLRTRTIALPKERRTSKSEVLMFFGNDELFVAATQGRLSSGVDRNYFKTCSASQADLQVDSRYYRTKIGDGIPLNKNRLAETFGKYRPDLNHLTFVVRTDSFKEFSKLREQCILSGFEYRLIVGNGLIVVGEVDSVKTQ